MYLTKLKEIVDKAMEERGGLCKVRLILRTFDRLDNDAEYNEEVSIRDVLVSAMGRELHIIGDGPCD